MKFPVVVGRWFRLRAVWWIAGTMMLMVATAAAQAPAAASPEVAKWLTQTSALFEASYQKDVQAPFEAGLTVLRKNYLASVNQAMETAMTERKLDEGQVYRAEREKFLGAGHKPPDDDSDNPSDAVKVLRSTFRKQFAQLDLERFNRAKALHGKCDPALAQMELALTQKQRAADAALLREKRGEMAKAPSAPRVEVNKETIRKAVEWLHSVGASVTVVEGRAERDINTVSQLPNGLFTIGRIIFDGPKLTKPVEDADLAVLAGLRSVRFLEGRALRVTDAGLGFLDGWKDVQRLVFNGSRITDAAVPKFASFGELHNLQLRGDPELTGKTLDKLSGLRDLRVLDLENSAIKDDGLAAISQLRGLEELSVQKTGITNEGVVHLGALRKLKRLNIGGNKLTSAALTPLTNLKDLEDFGFLTPELTDYPAAVKHVATSWPKMRVLRFIGGELRPEHVEPLAPLRGIKELYFQNVEVSEAAIAAMAKVPGLEELSVTYCTIGDGQIAAIAGLKKLHSLRLNNTQVTDEHLQKLKTMKGLKELEVRVTQVTPAGVSAFEREMPGCKVVK